MPIMNLLLLYKPSVPFHTCIHQVCIKYIVADYDLWSFSVRQSALRKKTYTSNVTITVDEMLEVGTVLLGVEYSLAQKKTRHKGEQPKRRQAIWQM